jgi:hypothetical protein
MLVLAVVLACGEPASGAGWPFAAVALEDPDGRPWHLGELAGVPALVAVADRGGSSQAVDWGRGIARLRPHGVAGWASAAKVAIVSVADLRAVPGFARGAARWAIDAMIDQQGGGATGPPLLLDWEGAVAGRLGPRDGVANLRLYDAAGTLVLTDEGAPTAEKLERLAAAIDAVLASTPAASPTPAASASPAALPSGAPRALASPPAADGAPAEGLPP